MQAVILAAGAGTRLRDVSAVKPLALLHGRPLLLHVIDRLAAAGADDVIVVLGYEADRVATMLRQAWTPCPVTIARNEHWSAPNGVSLLAAAPLIRGRALLTMSDHIVDPLLYARVAAAVPLEDGAVLGVDRRLGHPWVDEEDVTRVATAGDRIVAIGKHLAIYDAYDTGVFQITPGLCHSLAQLPEPSLTDGMRVLAAAGKARVIDCGDSPWLDVDDRRAFQLAEGWLADRAA